MFAPAAALFDASRLAVLNETDLLDGTEEILFSDLAQVAVQALGASAVTVSLVDDTREVVVSNAGPSEPWASAGEIPLSHSLCKHLVTTGELLIVSDAREDMRVASSPAVEEMEVAAYVGVPIRAPGGQVLGGLCVIDRAPRQWTPEEIGLLTHLASAVTEGIGARLALRRSERAHHPNRSQAAPFGSVAIFESLVEHSLAGIYLVQDNQFRYVNPMLSEIFGYSREEMTSSGGVLDLVADSDRVRVMQIRERLLRGEEDAIHYDFRGRRKDGSGVDVEVHGTRVEIDGQQMVVGTLIDRTDQRAAEEQLRRSEERYRLVSHATSDIILDWDVTTGALFWNGAGPQMLRYTADGIGKTIDWLYGQIHPEDRERIVHDQEVLLGGFQNHWAGEYRLLKGDGQYANILHRGYVTRDEQGKSLRMIGSLMDVTERRKAEEGQRFLARASAILDESLDYQKTLAGLARLAVPMLADYCLVDLVTEDGMRLQRVGIAHVDRSKESLLIREESTPLDADPERHPALRVVQTGKPILVSDCSEAVLDRISHGPEHRRLLGQLGLCSFMIVPLIAYERILGAITLATSDSERRYQLPDLILAEDLARRAAIAVEHARLYQEMRQAVQNREDVLKFVSHDLRNPLNTIRMTSALLLETLGERRSGNRRWIETIKSASEQMDSLIEDLFAVARIEAGPFPLERIKGDIRELLDAAQRLLEPLAGAKSIELVLEDPGDLPPVWIDTPQMLRVVSNLIGNAIKFASAGGAVRVRAEHVGEEVQVCVADTGPGIPEELLTQVFDRYWQARRGDRRGAGLGLAIAKAIVEAHGGRIWAESTPGRGASFFFSIPTPEEGGG